MEREHEITGQLMALQDSEDPAAWERLVPLVYAELRAIAHRQLHRECAGHTLSTTALVHEAYLKLVDQRRVVWQGHVHFFAIAAKVMRRVLIDYARHHRAASRQLMSIGTRGGRLDLDGAIGAEQAAADRADALVALDDALARLSAIDERLVRIVECRFFGGLTEEETALALGITARTVRRDWVKAKGWLRQALED